jgi:hypothetical protein
MIFMTTTTQDALYEKRVYCAEIFKYVVEMRAGLENLDRSISGFSA